ncbi:MAG TPA: nuclear transport factor 2 family protein [Conexibacter sp.]|nr:nuclear transport factor 2 family protein [Conexibacter sp.]
MDREELSVDALAERFIDAFNRRDADALVALTHPQIVFVPTVLVGQRASYETHEGLRRWVAELIASGATHQVRLRDVRLLDPDRFAALTEVLIEDEVISPSAMIARLRDGLIVHAAAYLSDERTLIRVGVLPPRSEA